MYYTIATALRHSPFRVNRHLLKQIHVLEGLANLSVFHLLVSVGREGIEPNALEVYKTSEGATSLHLGQYYGGVRLGYLWSLMSHHLVLYGLCLSSAITIDTMRFTFFTHS